MTKSEILIQINRLNNSAENDSRGSLIQAKEFFKIYIGNDNSFLKFLDKINSNGFHEDIRREVRVVLNSFKDYLENDLYRTISVEREIQLETVSDYLEQAEILLNDNKVHPAAAAVIIGASLEEFLRNWLEELNFDLTNIKNSIDAYSKELKTLEKINKQDCKDIVSWGGTRNDAAHGHWENVEDRQKIKLMLAGVNLFIRQYSGK